MPHSSIADEIIALKNKDIALRTQLVQKGQLGEGYHEEMQALHNQNAAALKAIIATIGYPTPEKVGEEASEAAWLIIQHAIGQPAFMKNCLKLLRQAVTENKANPLHLAYLSDRIAVRQGKPQRYGTQFDWDENGHLSPNSLDDHSKVNKRRRALGLCSIEAQTEFLRNQARAENHYPPTNYQERQTAMEQWRRAVGWEINHNRT